MRKALFILSLVLTTAAWGQSNPGLNALTECGVFAPTAFTLVGTMAAPEARARAVARPRQVAMYLSKLLTTKSLPEIGRRFGGRDHTTVIHAVKKVEELKRSDFQIAEDVELLRRMLEA